MEQGQVNQFWDIAAAEMERYEVRSYRALETAGGLANGTISQRAKRKLQPTETTITGIVQPLEVPELIVRSWLSKRPIVDDQGPRAARQAQMESTFSELSDDDQVLALAIFRTMAKRERGRGQANG